MKCPYCKTVETQLYKQVFSNGTKHLTERCPQCGRFPVKGKPFLPEYTVGDIDALPIWSDGSIDPNSPKPEPQLKFPKFQNEKPKPIYHHLSLRKQ